MCTGGLPRSCLSRVVSGCTSSFWSALHFNESGGSEASAYRVPSGIRCVINAKHFTTVCPPFFFFTRRSSSSHGRNSLFLDGWMGLNLCAKWSCDHTPHVRRGQTFSESLSSPNRVRQERDPEDMRTQTVTVNKKMKTSDFPSQSESVFAEVI